MHGSDAENCGSSPLQPPPTRERSVAFDPTATPTPPSGVCGASTDSCEGNSTRARGVGTRRGRANAPAVVIPSEANPEPNRTYFETPARRVVLEVRQIKFASHSSSGFDGLERCGRQLARDPLLTRRQERQHANVGPIRAAEKECMKD